MTQWCPPKSIIFLAVASFFLAIALSAYATEPTSLVVQDGAICLKVVDHEAIGAGNSFPVSAGKLYCLTRIVGAAGTTEISHVWYFGDNERARITLSVDSPNWRTYSSKVIQPHEIGPWQVVVLDQSDNLLQSYSFIITDNEPEVSKQADEAFQEGKGATE